MKVPTSWNGKIFYISDRFYKNLKTFYHHHYSLFDMFFLILYFLEQVVLIYSLFEFPNYTTQIVSIFAIVIITTISIQKTILDSKNEETRKVSSDFIKEYSLLLQEHNQIKNLKKDKKNPL